MDFKDFFLGELSVSERDHFAASAQTTRGMLTQVAYRNKPVELGFADVLVALSRGKVSLDGIHLTDRAKQQRRIREGAAPIAITAAAPPAARTANAPRKAGPHRCATG